MSWATKKGYLLMRLSLEKLNQPFQYGWIKCHVRAQNKYCLIVVLMVGVTITADIMKMLVLYAPVRDTTCPKIC